MGKILKLNDICESCSLVSSHNIEVPLLLTRFLSSQSAHAFPGSKVLGLEGHCSSCV